jgi:hypothetical protein
MSSPHPLNQAVITQALYDLRNGQLRHCQAMGFSPAALEALKQPALVSVLANAKVAWCSVKVNNDVLSRLLEQGRGVAREIAAIDRMLRLGASTEMLSEFHGLTHQEIALRRQMLGLPLQKGRPPVLTEAEDEKLFESCNERITQLGVAITDDAAMLAIATDLAAEQSLPLVVVWSVLRKWIDAASGRGSA